MSGSQLDSRKSVSPGLARAGNGRSAGRVTPRWRQIEILRERRALQEALDDFGDLEVELAADIFGESADEAAEDDFSPVGD